VSSVFPFTHRNTLRCMGPVPAISYGDVGARVPFTALPSLAHQTPPPFSSPVCFVFALMRSSSCVLLQGRLDGVGFDVEWRPDGHFHAHRPPLVCEAQPTCGVRTALYCLTLCYAADGQYYFRCKHVPRGCAAQWLIALIWSTVLEHTALHWARLGRLCSIIFRLHADTHTVTFHDLAGPNHRKAPSCSHTACDREVCMCRPAGALRTG
jgi:hypothetical protein